MTSNNNFYKIRIISGKWKGQKISVAKNIPELRPTQDRIRETLFNWLAPYIIGSDCLDLFAGSGVLAIEALSRGAKNVTTIEKSLDTAKKLKELQERFNTNLNINNQDAKLWLEQEKDKQFDIIFLDPPYSSNFVTELLPAIIKITKENGIIYYEQGTELNIESYEQKLTILKSSKAGKKYYGLLQLTG